MPEGALGLRKSGGGLRRFCAAALAVAALVMPEPATAGAWPVGEGHGVVIVGVTFADATEGFDAGADLTRALSFEKVELALYQERGLSARWTSVWRPSVQDLTLIEGDERATARGLGPTELALRYAAATWNGGAASLQAGVFAPGDGENAFQTAFGAGSYALETRVLVGHGWQSASWLGGMGGFVEGQVAGRFFDASPTNEARAQATFGLRPSAGWLAMAQSDAVWGGGGEAPQALPSYQRIKGQVSLVRTLTPAIGLEVGTYDTLAGRRAVKDRAAFVSLWVRY